MEGRHSYDHIIGGTPEEKDLIDKGLQDAFERKSESYSQFETEKTVQDIEVIKRTTAYVERVALQYTDRIKSIPEEKIHIVSNGGVKKMTNGEIISGVYNPVTSNIAIDREADIVMAATLAHELFHSNGYRSWRIFSKEKTDDLYRDGFIMLDSKNPRAKPKDRRQYFQVINEAIVETLTIKVVKLLKDDSLFQPEFEASQRIFDMVVAFSIRNGADSTSREAAIEEFRYIPNAQKILEKILTFSHDHKEQEDYAAGMFESLAKKDGIESASRYSERKMFEKLLDEILEKSPNAFTDREDIFTEFAKSYFDGNYLPIAEIVEQALGKGSFRRIANEFSLPKKIDIQADLE